MKKIQVRSLGLVTVCLFVIGTCIPAHNCITLSLICAYISVNKFDITCLSETYLDSSISCNNDNLEVQGYTLVRAINPNKTKRGGGCIYYLK